MIATLATITGLLGTLKTVPDAEKHLEGSPVFGATTVTITPTTSPYYRYLNYEPSTKPTVTTWNVCNKIPDIQGGGFTYLITYKGQPTWSTVSCE